MTWLLLATGFTGALTLVFAVRYLAHWVAPPPSASVHLTPKSGSDAVVREVQQARRDILVLAQSLTSGSILQALVEAKKRGVQVDVVLGRPGEKGVPAALPLPGEAGLVPLVDSQHVFAAPVIVIDQRVLLSGSYDFAGEVETQQVGSVLVVKGHSELVQAYIQEFLAHKAHHQAAASPLPAPSAAPAIVELTQPEKTTPDAAPVKPAAQAA